MGWSVGAGWKEEMTRLHYLAVPAPPANLSLGWASQPAALRACWSPPPGYRDGFQLQLYSLQSLTLHTQARLEAGALNFSWVQLPRGSEFLAQLRSLRGPDKSRSANATGWTRECLSCCRVG